MYRTSQGVKFVPKKVGTFNVCTLSTLNRVQSGYTKWASHIVFVLCSSLCIMHLMYVSIYENSRAYHSASCVFLLQLALHLARVGVVGALALVVWQADHLFGL